MELTEQEEADGDCKFCNIYFKTVLLTECPAHRVTPQTKRPTRPTHVAAQSSGRGVSVVYPLPRQRNLGRPFKGRVLRTAVLEIPDPHTFPTKRPAGR